MQASCCKKSPAKYEWLDTALAPSLFAPNQATDISSNVENGHLNQNEELERHRI